ncbi:MAG TPA: hypothetical protein VFP22_08845, partial [Candidatus Limnocylindrales bacterium]|nr:hypothetical protein [Candidatus Limnocylindrales bacterium]
TYARADAVDLRISARGTSADSASAERRVEAMTEQLLGLLGDHVWAEGATSWADAIEAGLPHGSRLVTVEIATGGSLAALLGDREWLTAAESLAADAPVARASGTTNGLETLARDARERAGATHALAVRVRPRGRDTSVTIVVISPRGVERARRAVFLGGANGRLRAALSAADLLVSVLRREGDAAARPRTLSASRGPRSG